MTSSNVKIIAEAGVNHNGERDKAFALIDEAAKAGADIVKFQSFSADTLVSENAPKADYQLNNTNAAESQYEMLKRLELSEDDHSQLIDYCRQKNIEFLSTPFDIGGLHMLVNQFGLKTVKLGSSELTNGPLLLAAAQTGRKIIISTGMGNLEEIREALAVLAYGYLNKGTPSSRSDFQGVLDNEDARPILQEKVTVLHCNTAYPTSYEDVNLSAMKTIYDTFGIPVGYSDHTMGIEVPIAAVALGATIIEKHFTLDRKLPGPDHKASLEPDELKAMVKSIRHIEQALGDGNKTPSPSEQLNIKMARKSLVASTEIKPGDTFSPDNVTIKRPATGCSPMEYWDIMGQKAKEACEQNNTIKENMKTIPGKS